MNTPIPKITQKQLLQAYGLSRNPIMDLDVVNKAIEIALAEQQESEYITAEQARELVRNGGEAEYSFDNVVWYTCRKDSSYRPLGIKYRAIKAQPEPADLKCGGGHDGSDYCSWCGGAMWVNVPEVCPVRARDSLQKQKEKMEVLAFGCQLESPSTTHCEKWCGLNGCSVTFKEQPADPHAGLRAEYAKQVAEGTVGFYLWEYGANDSLWIKCASEPKFTRTMQYRYTDISCMVAKQGEPAKRMLRTEAQELQRSFGDTVEWDCSELQITERSGAKVPFDFNRECTYTYAPKATIKLDGKMVTPEQAAAEWEAKKETCDVWYRSDNFLEWEIEKVFSGKYAHNWNKRSQVSGAEYELRPKALKQVSEIAELKAEVERLIQVSLFKEDVARSYEAKLAEVMPLAKFGAEVLNEAISFNAIDMSDVCMFAAKHDLLKDDGKVTDVADATIEQLLKD